MSKMAFSARDLGRAADIYDAMLQEKDCAIILCLAGSLISAGLKNVIVDLVRNNMVDAIVSTGAIIVDQDFFEALGFKHYKGDIFMNDDVLRRLAMTEFTTPTLMKTSCVFAMPLAAKLQTRSSRGRILRANLFASGRYLTRNGNPPVGGVGRVRERGADFCPAFSDCSAGFGLIHHQYENPDKHLSIDSAKRFSRANQN